MTKKQILILIGFIIILISVPISLYLVRQTQIFAPKAAFVTRVEFVDALGNIITETTSPDVKLRITKESVQPSKSPSPTPSPSSLLSIRHTTVDSNASFYGTYQSHNQKVAANANGIFMAYLQHTTNRDSSGGTEYNTWRLVRSTDAGSTFTTIYEVTDAYSRAPVIETDSGGNIYLVEANWSNPAQARFYKFSSGNNYASPVIQKALNLVTTSAKFAMEIDEARGHLYYFATGYPDSTFTIINLDGNKIAQYQNFTHTQTNPSPSGEIQMHYPHLYLDTSSGNLYAAWTTTNNTVGSYWSIHFIRSQDGGITWERPTGLTTGTTLALPINPSETGNSVRITLDEEFTPWTWLQSFIVKNNKVHFMYKARTPLNRMHYVRYDLLTAQIDKNIYPNFKGETISFDASSNDENYDGFCTAKPGNTDTIIYCVNRNVNPYALAVLRSDDNGDTWHDYAIGPTPQIGIYALGGSPQITSDGFIIGSFTESSDFSSSTAAKVVKFFKVPT